MNSYLHFPVGPSIPFCLVKKLATLAEVQILKN